MMGLVDEDWFPYWDTDILQNDYPAASNNTNLRHHRARARAIAQWAVNVVDFRDADSIMTPFEYDIYPFANNGTDTAPAGELLSTWEVDGNIETVEPNNRDIVWGCERPELLITETLAFHDRRTEDLDVGQTVADGDMEWDQRFRPQGSFFVELYNPWSVSQPKPAELNSADGVQLDKATPDNSDPVWRLAVCLAPNETYIDPDDTLLGTPSHLRTPRLFPAECGCQSGLPQRAFAGIKKHLSPQQRLRRKRNRSQQLRHHWTRRCGIRRHHLRWYGRIRLHRRPPRTRRSHQCPTPCPRCSSNLRQWNSE